MFHQTCPDLNLIWNFRKKSEASVAMWTVPWVTVAGRLMPTGSVVGSPTWTVVVADVVDNDHCWYRRLVTTQPGTVSRWRVSWCCRFTGAGAGSWPEQKEIVIKVLKGNCTIYLTKCHPGCKVAPYKEVSELNIYKEVFELNILEKCIHLFKNIQWTFLILLKFGTFVPLK